MHAKQALSPVLAATVGMLGLVAAMGIGRFAFTPLMPLMQAHAGLTLAQGADLAAANYAGYLAGALWCVWANPNSATAARVGLAFVALSTLAMGLTAELTWWMAWRCLAGAASALVLVGISAWALHQLSRAERTHWAGWVFAGVGVGIVFAGLVGLVIGVRGTAPSTGWLLLGAAAVVVLAVAWPYFAQVPGAEPASAPRHGQRFTADAWTLVGCYGIFGFGYIIPATFLPAQARQVLPDPALFGWTWPVFGLAAAASTIAASLILRNVAPRKVWAWCQVVMACGVAAPVFAASAFTLLFAAIAIGGTFMVLTMAGMQEARRIAGSAAPRLMAAMTAAFALGQLLGPVVVSIFSSGAHALRVPSIAAAVLLLAGAAILTASHRRRAGLSTH
ncbi:MAG: YbfB/YjiJ family MFS transporter [Casimicrobiaceae bacterium]